MAPASSSELSDPKTVTSVPARSGCRLRVRHPRPRRLGPASVPSVSAVGLGGGRLGVRSGSVSVGACSVCSAALVGVPPVSSAPPSSSLSRAARGSDEREGDRYGSQPQPALPHVASPLCRPGSSRRRANAFRSERSRSSTSVRRSAVDHARSGGLTDDVVDGSAVAGQSAQEGPGGHAPCSTTRLADRRQTHHDWATSWSSTPTTETSPGISRPSSPGGDDGAEGHLVGEGEDGASAGPAVPSSSRAGLVPALDGELAAPDHELGVEARARPRPAPARRPRCAGRARRSSAGSSAWAPRMPMRRCPSPTRWLGGDAADPDVVDAAPTGTATFLADRHDAETAAGQVRRRPGLVERDLDEDQPVDAPIERGGRGDDLVPGGRVWVP